MPLCPVAVTFLNSYLDASCCHSAACNSSRPTSLSRTQIIRAATHCARRRQVHLALPLRYPRDRESRFRFVKDLRHMMKHLPVPSPSQGTVPLEVTVPAEVFTQLAEHFRAADDREVVTSDADGLLLADLLSECERYALRAPADDASAISVDAWSGHRLLITVLKQAIFLNDARLRRPSSQPFFPQQGPSGLPAGGVCGPSPGDESFSDPGAYQAHEPSDDGLGSLFQEEVAPAAAPAAAAAAAVEYTVHIYIQLIFRPGGNVGMQWRIRQLHTSACRCGRPRSKRDYRSAPAALHPLASPPHVLYCFPEKGELACRFRQHLLSCERCQTCSLPIRPPPESASSFRPSAKHEKAVMWCRCSLAATGPAADRCNGQCGNCGRRRTKKMRIKNCCWARTAEACPKRQRVAYSATGHVVTACPTCLRPSEPGLQGRSILCSSTGFNYCSGTGSKKCSKVAMHPTLHKACFAPAAFGALQMFLAQPGLDAAPAIGVEAAAAAAETAATMRPLLLIGGPGTGKSFTTKSLCRELRGKIKATKQVKEDTFVLTATTGILGLQIGGSTLHSWAGVKLAKENKDELLTMVRQDRHAVKRWRAARVLFVDDSSRLPALLLDKLEFLAQKLRGNKNFFGGLALVLNFDFMQLLPSIDEEPMYRANCWPQLKQMAIVCCLTTGHRFSNGSD